MDSREEILKNTLDVLESIDDNFRINAVLCGDDADSRPTWLGLRLCESFKRKSSLKVVSYQVTLILNDMDEFNIHISRYDKYFDFLRSKKNRYNFNCTISKLDTITRKRYINSNANEIEFMYTQNDYRDIQRSIFNYFEGKNEYRLNYEDMKKSLFRNDKAKKCIDILSDSVCKKRKRGKNIDNLLND